MLYSDLDLRHLREVCDLDFAHYTYLPRMCTCCYGPSDMPLRYWRGGVVVDNPSYILFKNADNSGGYVRGKDKIQDYVCISYSFKSGEQLDKVLSELRRQMGGEYKVLRPEDSLHCIEVVRWGYGGSGGRY